MSDNTRTDGREDTPGNEPLPWDERIPKPEPEQFVPINRAARRAAARTRGPRHA